METNEPQLRNLLSIIAMNTGSLMILAGSVYILKELAYLYGVGAGSSITLSTLNITGNVLVTPIVAQLLQQVTMLRDGLFESYALFLIALIAVGSSFILFIRRHDRGAQRSSATYALLHTAFSVMYLLMLYIILSSLIAYFNTLYMYVVYLGVILCLASDAYMQYAIRQPMQVQTRQRQKGTLAIDPSKPFSSYLALQQQFSDLSGELRIVDKHFNSVALENLHRIMERSMTNFTKFVILTSKEMMDSSFGTDIIDFKKELNGLGVGLEVKLMDDKDAIEQHERFIMDDRTAYKIPPFNIINRRSEHITKISFSEADKRFRYLYGRAIKMENYAVKRARGEDEQQ